MKESAAFRTRSATEIIDAAFRLYRAHFGSLVTATGLLVVPAMILKVVLPEPAASIVRTIERLLGSLNRLVEAGHSVLRIEHHLDVIKTADHVIDLGPEGGHGGGEVVVTGTPEKVAACKASYTGRFLRAHLDA